MKIKFPSNRENDLLVCEKCLTPIDISLPSSEDGDIDFYWCEVCIDYRSGEVL